MGLIRKAILFGILCTVSGIAALACAEVTAEPGAEEEAALHSESANITVAIDESGPSPRELFVKPGATVAWVNNARSPVVIRFLSQAVSTTCKAPRRFSVGPAGIYVSEVLRPNDVAGLCFLEREEYPYRIEFQREEGEPGGEDVRRNAQGVVVVAP